MGVSSRVRNRRAAQSRDQQAFGPLTEFAQKTQLVKFFN